MPAALSRADQVEVGVGVGYACDEIENAVRADASRFLLPTSQRGLERLRKKAGFAPESERKALRG